MFSVKLSIDYHNEKHVYHVHYGQASEEMCSIFLFGRFKLLKFHL